MAFGSLCFGICDLLDKRNDIFKIICNFFQQLEVTSLFKDFMFSSLEIMVVVVGSTPVVSFILKVLKHSINLQQRCRVR